MSQYLPVVSWSTIASNVTLGATAYRYYITVNPLDPNEAGASPMTVAINDWFIDFAGYPFLIENVAGSVLTVYDILERGDGVISAYAPYADKLGYVYRPINNAFLLSQSQLRKLDRSAADVIQNIEKAVIQKSLNEKATNNPGISAETPITVNDISINYTTRVLTIIPPLGYFDFFTDGGGVITKHTKTGSVDFPAFTDTSGAWFFYFDNSGNPISTQTPWTDFTIIAPVMRVVWNSTKSPDSAKAVAEFIEYHVNDISAIDHAWKHKYGAIWLTGLDIFNNAQLSGSPNADGRNTVIALSSGTNIDDNLPYTITNDTTPTTYWEQDLGVNNNATLNATNSALFKIRYKGVGGSGELEAATRFPFLWDTGTNRPQYVNGSGVKTLVSNGYFFVYFVYAVQDGRVGNTIRVTPAYAEYSSITNARAVTWETVQTQDEAARDTEIRPLYRLIFEYKSAYNVGCKYTLLCEVQDIRKTIITQTTLSAGSISASSVIYTPAGAISSTNVQNALTELDDEKVPYTGAIRNVDLGTYTLTAKNLIATDLTNGYVPYKTTNGLENSPISVSGTDVTIATLNGLLLGTSGLLSTLSSLNITYGGTGITSYTQGDLLYYSSGNSLSKLNKSTSANYYLKNSGVDNNPAWASITDADLVLSDITTNNASSSNHGFLPKLPNDTSKWLRGDGSWVTISVDYGNFLDSVIRMVVDNSFDPSPITTGDRYILETTSLHANFGTITGLGVHDIVQYNGSAFTVVFDASAATSPATVTVGIDKNGASNHDWTYNVTDDIWVDRGTTTLHNSLSDLNTGVGQYYHLTSGQYDLVAGITSSYSELNYLDGTTVTSGRVLFGDGTKITNDSNFSWNNSTKQLTLAVSTGTPPLIVTSTTLVSNLNSDKVDGYDVQTSLIDTNDRLMRVGAFGIGTGVASLSADTGDVLSFTDTRVQRVANSATNIPTAKNGYKETFYRTATYNKLLFHDDDNDIWTNTMKLGAWSGWNKLYHSGNSNLATIDWTTKNLTTNGTTVIQSLSGLIYGTSGILSGLSGTGFVKSSGTTIIFDNSTYQLSDATLTSLASVSGVQGDLLYASGTDTWTRLAKSTTANSFLKNSGTNNNPVWSTISTSEVSEGTNLYFTNDRVIASLLTGYTATSGTVSATDSILQAIQKLGYDKHVAVTLATNNGLSLAGQVLAMGTPSTVTSSSTNSVTTSTHTHAITAGLGFIGNGSAQYQVPVTGATPFTPTWTTATKIFGATGLNSLTYASTAFVKMTGTNTFSLDTNTYLTANQTITLSGAVTGSGTTAITTSLATPATITGSTTNTGGTGAHTHAISLSFDNLTDVVLTTPNQGSVLYFNGTNWVNLAPGTNGYFLKTQGVGANPVWAASTATPGGSDTYVQFNDGGVFGGESSFRFSKTVGAITITPTNYINYGLYINTSNAPFVLKGQSTNYFRYAISSSAFRIDGDNSDSFGTYKSIIVGDYNGGCDLYYNGAKKTETETYGLLITGYGKAEGFVKPYQSLASSTSVTMNVRSGQNAKITLGHNVTLTLSNLEDGDEGNIVVTQDATGSRTLTISPTPKVINGGGGAIVLTATANATDMLSYTYTNSILYITYGKNYS